VSDNLNNETKTKTKTNMTSSSSNVGCPCCSSTNIDLNATVNGISMMSVCGACNAVFGQCYLGDSYKIAKAGLVNETPGAATRYFDLTCVGSAGITRRHGWLETRTGRVVQIG
jgi:hypothetical protein